MPSETNDSNRYQHQSVGMIVGGARHCHPELALSEDKRTRTGTLEICAAATADRSAAWPWGWSYPQIVNAEEAQKVGELLISHQSGQVPARTQFFSSLRRSISYPLPQ